MQLYYIANYSQWLGSLAIALSCLHHFPKRRIEIKTLGIYACISFVLQFSQAISEHYLNNQGITTIGNSFVILETICLSFLYYKVYGEERLRWLPVLLSIGYVTFILVVFINFPNHSFSLIRVSRDAVLMLYGIAYFRFLLKATPEANLLKFHMFWINAASLFFFSGTFILSLMVDYIVTVLNDDLVGFWAFRNFFRFAFCLVLAYAAWLEWRSNPNRPTSTSSGGSSSLS